MITLAIENSSSRGSVALLDGESIVLDWLYESPRGRGTGFFVALEAAIQTGVKPGRIVVGTGPGSYNGIRSAIAAAWGVALANGLGLVGISSLLGHESEEYLAVGDARSGQYYYAHIRSGQFLEKPFLMSPDGLREKIALAGDLAIFCPSEMSEFPLVQVRHPTAVVLSRHAVGDAGTAIPEPLYLKPPHITAPRSAA